jgi:4-hydroxy-tetrahydrodipicolinate reductase
MLWSDGWLADLRAGRPPGEEGMNAPGRRRLRTAHYGLGEIGRQVVALLAPRPDVKIVAALDADPLKVGRDVGEVAGLASGLGVAVSYDPECLGNGENADVVIHATSPYLSVALPQLLPLLASGKSIISACDELVYPWVSHPEMAARLDATAKENGAALLAVGAGPGFVTDSLPLFLASACAEVEAVSVTRVIDLTKEPATARAAAGLGMTVDAFCRAADEGTVGFPALLDSVSMMAARLGWQPDKLVETIEPIRASKRRETDATIVETGRVVGIRQLARGYRGGAEILTVSVIALLGAPDPHDTILVRGRPPISAHIEGGIPSHLAIATLMVHALPAVASARPGLLSVTDLLSIRADRRDRSLSAF